MTIISSIKCIVYTIFRLHLSIKKYQIVFPMVFIGIFIFKPITRLLYIRNNDTQIFEYAMQTDNTYTLYNII